MFDPQTFWLHKPACIARQDWLTHPGNLQRFPSWTQDLLLVIEDLSRLCGRTFFCLSWLAERMDRSLRWIKEILGRLEKIGMISKIKTKINHYSLCEAREESPQSASIDPESENNNKEIAPRSRFTLHICRLFAFSEARAGRVKDAEAFSRWAWLSGAIEEKIFRWARERREAFVGG